MRTHRRSRRKRWPFVVLVLTAAIALLGAWVWQRTRSAPSWYVPRDGTDPGTVILAERVEYRVVEEMQRVRSPEQPWTVRVREDQVNAWLAARLPEWIAHEAEIDWPDELGTPQIRVEEAGISVAIPLHLGDRPQVLTTRVQPVVSSGRIRLRLDRVGIGRVTLPGPPIEKLRQLVQQAAPAGVLDDPSVQRILDILSGEETVDAQLDLTDDRRIDLMELIMGNGAIDLTCRTAAPGP